MVKEFLSLKMIFYIDNICTGYNISDNAQVGCDPHFYLPLANGDHLCFSIQGQPNFAFNLIRDKYIQINAEFVLPAEDESNTIANVSTFIGDLGMVIRNKDMDKRVVIHVSAQDHSVLVDDSLVIVKDKPVFVDVSNGTVAISINADSQNTKVKKDESAWLYINTEGFGVKVKFYKKHLDMLFTETSGLGKDVLGLIGMQVILMIQSTVIIVYLCIVCRPIPDCRC